MIGLLPKWLRRFALSTGLLLAAPAFAERPAPPAEVVKAVTASLREAGLTPRKIAKARGLYRPVMLTGGAAPDWIVDMNAAPSGMLCGTGGCPIEVWVAQGGSYRRAMSLQVLGYRVEADGRLSLTLHGVHCGKTGSDECRYRFGWLAAKDGRGWFLPLAPESAGGYSGPLVQAIALAPHAIPELAAREAAYAAWCGKNGGTPETEGAAALLPDLTGDALPDALFDASRALCTATDQQGAEQQVPCPDSDACQSLIYTSTDTGWQTGIALKPFDYWIKWISGRPRMAIADADCGMCQIRQLDLAH